MSVKIRNLVNKSRKIVSTLGPYTVVEYEDDLSVADENLAKEYFMSQTGVRRRQLFVKLDNTKTLVLQAGEMQWVAGNIKINSGVKSTGDFMQKFFKSSVTKETVVKPEYSGSGIVVLEPTYKFIILQDVGNWGEQGMVIEKGMFLAGDKTVQHSVITRKNISSAALGNEGIFNLCLKGKGIVALESRIPESELIEVELENDVLKIDGSYAICWSASLDFSVGLSEDTVLGSVLNKEKLVNIYKGTGKILISSIKSTHHLTSIPKDKE